MLCLFFLFFRDCVLILDFVLQRHLPEKQNNNFDTMLHLFTICVNMGKCSQPPELLKHILKYPSLQSVYKEMVFEGQLKEILLF